MIASTLTSLRCNRERTARRQYERRVTSVLRGAYGAIAQHPHRASNDLRLEDARVAPVEYLAMKLKIAWYVV
jgi:hypothetical protein